MEEIALAEFGILLQRFQTRRFAESIEATETIIGRAGRAIDEIVRVSVLDCDSGLGMTLPAGVRR